MYSFSKRLKLSAIIFMILGALGIAYGFLSAPKTTADVKEMMQHNATEHHETTKTLATHNENNTQEHNKSEEAENNEEVHISHMLKNLQNRPYTAVYIAMLFFFMLAIGTLAFYAAQYASQAGWSIVLYRVMEGITAYVLPGSLIIFGFLILSALNGHYYFEWMNPQYYVANGPHYDEVLMSKSWYLNIPFWMIRSFIFLLGWNFYRYYVCKHSIAQDNATDLTHYKKNFKASIIFLLFFIITESVMSWDWIMSLTPHWQSTLFGWYVFSCLFVSSITVIALVTIYLKAKGFLPHVNDSHLHDLAKYMFGFSIFWTYLWFSQFMLIWYANIPEEAAYFMPRLLGSYQILFMGMLVSNFVFPILVLMNSDYKRILFFIILTVIIVLIVYYLDVM